MLDDLTLSKKLEIARIWFEQAQAGEFDLAGREAKKFGELLGECEQHAAGIERAVQSLVGRELAKAEEPAPSVPAEGTILQFIRGMAMPRVVRP